MGTFTNQAAGLSNFSCISFPTLQAQRYLIPLLSGQVYCTETCIHLERTEQKEASKAMAGCIYYPDDKRMSHTTDSLAGELGGIKPEPKVAKHFGEGGISMKETRHKANRGANYDKGCLQAISAL